jgi:hypothetical protein
MANLKAGGYDFVFEVNEKFPNKLVAAYYYMGKFPRLGGSFTLPVANVPEELLDFITITYDVKFGLPKLDFIAMDKVQIFLSSESNFTILGGLPFKLEIFFSIITSVGYDEGSRQLFLDFTNPLIDIEINDRQISQRVLDKFNEILSIILKEYLLKDVEKFDLAPFVGCNLSIPETNQDFPISFKNCKITGDMLAVAVNCLNYSGGDKSSLEDFTAGTDLSIAVSQDALQRILDFYWLHAALKTQISSRGVVGSFIMHDYIKNLDTFLDLLHPLGFISSLFGRVEGFSVTYDYTIDMERPDLNIRPKNKIQLHGRANVHFTIRLNLHYKRRKWKKYKFVWKHYTRTLGRWSDDARISYLGSAQILLNNGNLSADLNWLRVLIDVDDFPKMLDVVITVFANVAADKLLKKFPPIELGSIPLVHDVPGTKLKLKFAPSLTTSEYEVFVKTPVEIYGLENYPPAPYIANRNPSCKEVHLADCEWVKLMAERHKVAYYWLEEAHRDGFDNCHHCLGDSTR